MRATRRHRSQLRLLAVATLLTLTTSGTASAVALETEPASPGMVELQEPSPSAEVEPTVPEPLETIEPEPTESPAPTVPADPEPTERPLTAEMSAVAPTAAPKWQLPFKSGQRWRANGPHTHSGATSGIRNALDFGPAAEASSEDVVAVAAGEVSISGDCDVRVNHGDGWVSTYTHLSGVQTSLNGKDVQAGTKLGSAGTNPCGGSASAKHVHLGIWHNGSAVNVDGFKFGNYTVHAGSSIYLGKWKNSSGSTVINVPATGYMTCCLKSTTKAEAAPSAAGTARGLAERSVTYGDFDGDGYDDLVIGSPGEDIGSIKDAGQINIVYGSATGLSKRRKSIFQSRDGKTDSARRF